MKKILTLFVVAFCAVSVYATSFTFKSDKDTLQTKDGITVRLNKGKGQSKPAYYDTGLRLYANNTITITGDSLGSALLTCSKQGKKGYATLSASTGDLVSGGTSTGDDDKVVDEWTGSKNTQVVFTVGSSGQRLLHKIVINDDGSTVDTTKVEGFTGLEIDYYPSYSEEGAYDYTFILYGDEENDYIPQVGFDILTKEEKSYAGTYSFADGTLTEYSYYAYDAEEDALDITDGKVTITDNGEGNYTIKGWFTDGEEYYSVDATLDGEYRNAEYPGEPEDPASITLTIAEGEEDNTYAEEYGEIGLSFTTSSENTLTLVYMLADDETVTAIPDGTYSIEEDEYDEEGYLVAKDHGYFEAGYYYSYYQYVMGCNYMTEEEVYYLVSGTVTVETTQEGKKVTLAGTSYFGSTINAEYTFAPSALGETTERVKAEGKYLKGNQLLIRQNGVVYNAQGQVVK